MPNQQVNILISPAPFKGILSGMEAANAIKEGVLVAQPGADVKVLPMSDGGTGTVLAVHKAQGGKLRELEVSGPMGQIVKAAYTIINKGKTAVIEMASAAGYIYMSKGDIDPLLATTGGVGQLILDAARQGCSEIIIGLGDSATVDVGIGMISGLGAKFLDSHGEEVVPIPKNFSDISRIDMSEIDPLIRKIKFYGYADVVNPVLGPNGAVRVYGPQKGVSPEMIPELEAGVTRMIELMESEFEMRLHDEPMTGAAGGLGAGIMAFSNGSLLRGASAIAKLINLESEVKKTDIVITGEGKLDKQSLSGKAVSKVLELAVKNNKPCWAVVGKSTLTESKFEKIFEISPNRVPESAEEAVKMVTEQVGSKLLRHQWE